ncbi:MAG: UDP-N-acetylglucosamine 1-carboxyvinyltransferase [Lachnospiraceae bacterium]|nr:UDP-N-acetylglucosamine 1-carboxyvinyltransferase [Lachnospiraceae bacterium]
MSYVKIVGGKRLKGEVKLQGSKNAALPILAASVLCRGQIRIENCPDIADVHELLYALSFAGIKNELHDGRLDLDTSEAVPFSFGQEFAKKTRGGILLLGAFLGRFHEAEIAYPGGCVIGARPIDLHCSVLRALHVSLSEEKDGVYAKGRPQGDRILLSYPSVGATENAVLAAVCGKGRTELFGAATEPEVAELCRFLNKAGARIRGIGTSYLVIDGVSQLHGVHHRLSGDRIVAGTYLCAAAMTGGEVILRETDGVCLEGITNNLCAAGLRIQKENNLIAARANDRVLAVPCIRTAPFPAFPTDMQSQMVALLSVADGDSVICETVFESRFGIVPELQKMGADVINTDRYVIIHGVKHLQGRPVTATDLRGGAALVLAGLAAEGESKVCGYEYIARGYENICGSLCKLGAEIMLTEE